MREFVQLLDFPRTEKGEYVVGSYRLEEISKPMHRGGENAFVGVEMRPRGWDMVFAYAAYTFTFHPSSPTTAPKEVKVAVLGLLGKMTGGAVTRLTDMFVESNGRLRIWASLKALGSSRDLGQ